MEKAVCFFLCAHSIEYHPHNYIIEYLSHSWGTTLKKCLDAVFFFKNKGLMHLIIWKTLHFKALTWIWLSKVNGPALLKERWRKHFVFFRVHDRVPSTQLYYWVSEPLMRYHLEKMFGCCFFLNEGLMHSFLENLAFQGFDMDMAF